MFFSENEDAATLETVAPGADFIGGLYIWECYYSETGDDFPDSNPDAWTKSDEEQDAGALFGFFAQLGTGNVVTGRYKQSGIWSEWAEKAAVPF